MTSVTSLSSCGRTVYFWSVGLIHHGGWLLSLAIFHACVSLIESGIYWTHSEGCEMCTFRLLIFCEGIFFFWKAWQGWINIITFLPHNFVHLETAKTNIVMVIFYQLFGIYTTPSELPFKRSIPCAKKNTRIFPSEQGFYALLYSVWNRVEICCESQRPQGWIYCVYMLCSKVLVLHALVLFLLFS